MVLPDRFNTPIHEAERRSSFLGLPLEIRQQIYSYLLPTTINLHFPKRANGREIAWRRGNIALLAVNNQVYVETASMLYGGRNTFVLEVDYDGIRFQFQRLMKSGLMPKQTPRFLDKIATRNLTFLKNVIVNVNHVDSYTGMIKYNCGGRGLTNGIKLQVKKLVDVLKTAEELSHLEVHLIEHKIDKRSSQEALEPFGDLDNLTNEIIVTGTDSSDFLKNLRHQRKAQPCNKQQPVHDEDGDQKAYRKMPDLALANFYEDIHAAPKELQGF